MKICVINENYLNKKWDGISAYTHYFAQGLKDSGHEVHIICRSPDKREEKQDNIWIHKIGPLWRLDFKKKIEKSSFFQVCHAKLIEPIFPLFHTLRTYLKFREIDRKYGIDIVEAPEVGAEGFWLSIFYRRKLVTRFHTPLYLYWTLDKVSLNLSRRFLNFMEKIQTKRSVLLSSPSQSLAQIVSEMWQIKKNKIEIIPNPIDLKQSKNYQKIRDKGYLLYLGRIERRKGVDVFFKALESVLKKYPELKILFVGGIEGTYDEGRLKKIPSRINKNLIFVGEINHSQVFSYIRGAKLVILPSLWENFAYTLLESMSLGKVVIASNCGGFKEVIKDNQNGFLIKPGSYQHLAQKIIECLKLDKNKIETIEKNARKTAQKYDIEKIVPKMINFYSKIKPLDKKL